MNLVWQYQVTAKPRDPDHFSQIWSYCSQSPPDLVLLCKVLLLDDLIYNNKKTWTFYQYFYDPLLDIDIFKRC